MASCSKRDRHTTSWRVVWFRMEETASSLWKVAANILNKQSRTADKGWSSIWGLDEGLTTPRRKNQNVKCYTGTIKAVEIGHEIGTWMWGGCTGQGHCRQLREMLKV